MIKFVKTAGGKLIAYTPAMTYGVLVAIASHAEAERANPKNNKDFRHACRELAMAARRVAKFF